MNQTFGAAQGHHPVLTGGPDLPPTRHYIRVLRIASLDLNQLSLGCIRVDNEAITALAGLLPMLKRVMSEKDANRPNSSPGSGQSSTVQGRYIRMTLDHDTGDIDGEILTGRFQGKTLGELELDSLLELLEECRDDDESVALLEAYLDRM